MASTARIDELRKKFDENPRRYFAPLANEFRKAGEIEQAIMICEEFLPQQPGHMSGHIVYGQALYEASRLQESRTVFETALTLDPENLIALRHLGDIARGQGDAESARRWYDRVLEADPRNEEIQALIALIDSDGASGGSAPGRSDTANVTSTSEAPTSASPWDAPPPLPPPLPAANSFDRPVDYAPPALEQGSVPPASDASEVATGRAEGLESIEFSPLAGPVDRAHDLGSSLEPGEFTRPSTDIEPLAGLEDTSVGAFERNTPDGGPELVMLDTSEPTSRRTDPAESDPPVRAAPEFERADDPDLAARGMIAPPPAERDDAAPSDISIDSPPERAMKVSTLDDDADRIPPELPPSVIAAEAALMDFGDPLPASVTEQVAPPMPAPPREAPQAETAPPAAAPFVTETMAELFVKQGLRDQALQVYRQLLSARPGDQRLAARIAELQPAAPALEGQSIRDFLGRFAALQPATRLAAAAPPSNDDFAPRAPMSSREPVSESSAESSSKLSRDSVTEFSLEAWPEPAPTREPESFTVQDAAPSPRLTPSSVMSTGLERGAASQAGGGSIDALFGTRPSGTSEDSAASALAQAFGGGAESPPVISGRPARAAAGELSLDSVFRGGAPRPPRASQSFSFDEFFAPDSSSKEQPVAASSPPAQVTSDPSVPTEPAERNADDIEQFNSWLQGLKPK